MASTLTGLLTAAGEASMKEWNLMGRSFIRGIPVWENIILEKAQRMD